MPKPSPKVTYDPRVSRSALVTAVLVTALFSAIGMAHIKGVKDACPLKTGDVVTIERTGERVEVLDRFPCDRSTLRVRRVRGYIDYILWEEIKDET